MKRILHLMRNTNFTKGVVKYYDKFFNDGQHEICYITSSKNKGKLISPQCNIAQTEFLSDGSRFDKIRTLIKYIREYDYIVLHSLGCLEDFGRYACLLPKSIFRKKFVWIEWGGDLYTKRNSKVTEALRNRVRKSVNTVVAIFPPDVDIYKKKFPNSKAKVFYAPYNGGTIIPQYYNNIYDKPKLAVHDSGSPVYIQVGNNAKKEHNHIKTLSDLEKFKDENIVIFMPLSYGSDKEYADKVEEYAVSLFGKEKTLALRQMMERKAYFELLDKIDIAIFNTKRQIGLGNINSLIWQKTKIYMQTDNPMFGYFHDNGVSICDYNDIAKSDFNKFCKPQDDYNEEKFSKYIYERTHLEVGVKKWQNVYDSLPERK